MHADWQAPPPHPTFTVQKSQRAKSPRLSSGLTVSRLKLSITSARRASAILMLLVISPSVPRLEPTSPTDPRTAAIPITSANALNQKTLMSSRPTPTPIAAFDGGSVDLAAALCAVAQAVDLGFEVGNQLVLIQHAEPVELLQ